MASVTNQVSPPIRGIAVTPSDTANLPYGSPCRYIYVGGAGNVALQLANDTAPITFIAVPVGTILPAMAIKVLATGTTATNLLALY